MPDVNSAQQVLTYLLTNKKVVAHAYRNRLYRFSSGTICKECTRELKDWLTDDEGEDIPERYRLFREVYVVVICVHVVVVC
jgi:hypothetical protein